MEVLSPIKAVLVVYELIVKLLSIQERRRKVLFDEFLKPTFESLQDVHEFYRSIFLKLRDGIDRFVEPDQELRAVNARDSLIAEAQELREQSHSLRAKLVLRLGRC